MAFVSVFGPALFDAKEEAPAALPFVGFATPAPLVVPDVFLSDRDSFEICAFHQK